MDWCVVVCWGVCWCVGVKIGVLLVCVCVCVCWCIVCVRCVFIEKMLATQVKDDSKAIAEKGCVVCVMFVCV